MKKPVAVIVDGYSSGNLLAPEFRARGFDCVHVQSTREFLEIYRASYKPEHYVDHLVWGNDLEDLTSRLREVSPACVLPGAEPGVELADALSEKLGLPTNGARLSTARRDKYAMSKQIERCDLSSIPQLKTSDADEALTWINKNAAWPAVLKPLNSGGNDGVTVCQNEAQARDAFRSLFGKYNLLGLRNEAVLVQKKITGPEYVVDTVSCVGKHHVVAFWQIFKGSYNGADFIYEKSQLLESTGPVQDVLSKYIFSVLDALEIKYGPGHSEVVLTADGPTLMETGARLHGAGFPKYVGEAADYTQTELTVDAYVDADAFVRKTLVPYHLRRHLLAMEFVSQVQGTIRALPYLEAVRGLPTFHSTSLALKPGDDLRKTTDGSTTVPGSVILVHEDPGLLEADYAQIRDFERRGFFEVS